MTTKAKRKPKVKPRKPKDILDSDGMFVAWIASFPSSVCVDIAINKLKPKDCRKLAAWLIKAAEYLEHREGK